MNFIVSSLYSLYFFMSSIKFAIVFEKGVVMVFLECGIFEVFIFKFDFRSLKLLLWQQCRKSY